MPASGNLRRLALATLGGLLLSACATPPVMDAAGPDPALTPLIVTARIDPALGRRVLWGGGIVSSVNRETSTEIEVLAYPLRASQRPDDRAAPLGRFLAVWPGYLETVDYTQGRRVTVRGRIVAVRQGRVGQAAYLYPVVEAEQIYLWPQEVEPDWRSLPVQLGIGIWISN